MKKLAPYILLLALVVSCNHRPTAPALGPDPPPEPVREGVFLVWLDDGFQSQIDLGLPILDSLGIKANFAVVTGWLYVPKPGHFDWWDALDLRDAGHSVLNHSKDHAVPPSSLSVAAGHMNIAQRDMDTTCFIWPNGHSDSTTMYYVAMYHPTARRCSTELVLTEHFDYGDYEIPAVMVTGTTPAIYYKNLMLEAKTQKKVVNLVFHTLCDWEDCGESIQRVHVDKFREIMIYAIQVDLPTYTVAEYLVHK